MSINPISIQHGWQKGPTEPQQGYVHGGSRPHPVDNAPVPDGQCLPGGRLVRGGHDERIRRFYCCYRGRALWRGGFLVQLEEARKVSKDPLLRRAVGLNTTSTYLKSPATAAVPISWIAGITLSGSGANCCVRLFGFPCLWKASLLRGALFSVRPRPLRGSERERAETSAATHGASKLFALDGAGA